MIITKGTILYDQNKCEYEIESSLAPGGFGQVFISNRKYDRKLFAIKTMLNGFASSEDYKAIQNELNTASKVSSENIIDYEYFHDGTVYSDLPPYIIMELANNGTLRELIDSHISSQIPFIIEELTNYFLQLCNGMLSISEQLVHRDIKPENILLCDNTLKITDFGLAKYVDATTRLNNSFKGYGTSAYCSPEVWRSEKNTMQMDIYSMGIVFYELATLSYPYTVSFDNYKDAHLYGSVIPITAKSVPPYMISVILRMLQKPCSKRFGDWKDIIQILQENQHKDNLNDTLLSLVSSAVGMQNTSDSASIEKENKKLLREEQQLEHCKQIMSFFNEEILQGIIKYSDLFNLQSALSKIRIQNNFNINKRQNQIIVNMPNSQKITISLHVLYEDDFKEIISYERYGSTKIPNGTRSTYPYCNKRKVLAWGKFEDNFNYGYNILLLENPEDDYGDWFILYNTNSGFSRSRRIDPFAFDYSELPNELPLINTTHIYTSKLEEYNIDRFHELITLGHFRPN